MIARPGALRIDEAGTCPADHWLTAKVRYPWITTDPAEAWEILDARGLLPPEGARGFRAEMPVRASFGDGPEGDAVVYTMHARPATIPDLVAWASLGASAIVTAVLGAEELCAKVAGELAALCVPVDPCERVVWRVAREPLSPSAFAGRFTRAGRGTAQRAFVKSFDLGADGGLWEVGAAAVTRDPTTAALVATGIGVAVQGALSAYANNWEDRARLWWGVLCDDGTRSAEAVAEEVQARAARDPKAAQVILESARALADAVDDDVARVIGALTREYVAGGRGADRFFRGAVTLLRTSTVQDLREVARVIDAVCEVANGRNVKVYSETDGGQEETGIGVCQDLPGELNPAGTKLPWEEPSRMIHLLRTSGIGWTRAVFSGDAWVIAPDDAHRLRQIFALLPP